MTTALLLLRCSQIGLSIADMDALSIGLILDMFTENINDDAEYGYVATQDDFDRF